MSVIRKRYLALDAMGVVFINEDDIEELLIPFLKKRYDYLDVEKLRHLYYDQLSLGKISSKEFFTILNIPNIEKEYLDTCLILDPDFLSVAKDLCEKYVLTMFSNDVSEWSLYLRRKYELDKYFSKYVISGDVGIRKPDLKIYQRLLEELDIQGKKCIFVDNSPKNLEPASKMDITTVHFKRSESDYRYKPDFVVKDFFELKELLLKNL